MCVTVYASVCVFECVFEFSAENANKGREKKEICALTLLSFLYHVSVASGLPPDETQSSFCTEPAGIICPSI